MNLWVSSHTEDWTIVWLLSTEITPSPHPHHHAWSCVACHCLRVQLKCDGTRWRTGGEVKGKLANGVGSQYPSHYLGTWCIQHYYRWCAHLGWPVVNWTDAPRRVKWTRQFRLKDEIWFLRVCHHVSTGLYSNYEAGNVRLNVALRRIRVISLGVEKQ